MVYFHQSTYIYIYIHKLNQIGQSDTETCPLWDQLVLIKILSIRVAEQTNGMQIKE